MITKLLQDIARVTIYPITSECGVFVGIPKEHNAGMFPQNIAGSFGEVFKVEELSPDNEGDVLDDSEGDADDGEFSSG